MEKIQHIIAQAEQHCKAHGSRLTSKRKQVLSGLLLSAKALSAYELISFCKAEFGASLSAMSMYRILDFLQSEHLVHKLNLVNKYVACTRISCGQAHAVSQFLICEQCQKVKETTLSQSTLVEFQKNIEQAGFHLVNPQFEVNCICEACMANTA